jgi:hypothetical protein
MVSYYNGITDRIGHKVSALKILRAIKLGFYQERIDQVRANPGDSKIKLKLPAATWSGSFSERKDKNLESYSGIVCLDVDERDYQKVMMAKIHLMDDPFVFAFFESPRKGLKILIKVDSSAEHHRDHAFPELKGYIEDNYGIEVDASGKNLSRLCFVSADPEMYLNENAEVYSVDVSYKPDEYFKYASPAERDGYRVSDSLEYIFSKVKEWTDKHGHFVKGNRNNYIFILASKLNRAGVSQYDAERLVLHRLNPNLPYKEINTTIKGVYQRHASEHGTRPVWEEKKSDGTLF